MYNFKDIEEKVSKVWDKNRKDIDKSLQYDDSKKLFSFLEGPPTANAPPALHHVEVRVFKDLFCRFKYMQGFNVIRKGGWDCHGLPVEVQIEKELKLNSKKDILDYGVDKFVKNCRESVFSYIKEWRKLTEKMAFWIDLDNPYITMNNDYIESVWWSLKELYNKKLLYEGHKVVPFCPRCETPLSSHEVALGYKDVSEDSVTVRFKIKDNEYFLVWTTTPWTLPSNLALAVNSEVDYVKIKKGDSVYILARDLMNKYFEGDEIIETVKGKELVGMKYEPIFPYFKDKKPAFVVLGADFVTTDEGTGVVHMAPAFGDDDYNLCKENKIAFVQPITPEGKFTKEVSDFEGKFVKDADAEIIEYLGEKDILFKTEKYMHSYPFCWRCDSPLIYYAMDSWFIDVVNNRDKLVELNKGIDWSPKHIKDGRFGKWLEGAKDWALSRTKFWGTPLPIWRCECGNDVVIGSIEELKEKSVKKFSKIDLHKPAIDEIKIKCDKCSKKMSRVSDVVDAWYDSGCAPFAQYHYPFENKEIFDKSMPYDFIVEAIDQTRGWFYTLHVLGALLFNEKAYKSVVCAGHLIDQHGEKMSKSKGNVLDPWNMFDTVGVDAVRLQMCTTDPGEQKKFSVHSVNEYVFPFLKILWNSYLYSKNLKEGGKVEIEDKWIVSRVNSLVNDVTVNLEKHSYHHCFSAIVDFVENDLSRWYIKLVRGRDVGDVLEYVFERLCKLLAVFAPYISEYIYQDLIKEGKSVHLLKWPKSEGINVELEDGMRKAKKIVASVLSQRDVAKIGIRWPLSKVLIYLEKPDEIKDLGNIIKKQVNVKELDVRKGDFSVKLDTNLNPELEKEGYAREVMRRVQEMRKVSGLKVEDKIELSIVSDYDLSEFSEEIKKRVGAEKVVFESNDYSIKGEKKIKDKIFMIGFDKV